MWLSVLNDQFEVRLVIIFKDFALRKSTLTLTCVHDVRPEVRFEWLIHSHPD